MKKHTHRSRRTERDYTFTRFAIAISSLVILLVMMFICTAISAEGEKDESTFEPDPLIIDTTSSRIIGPVVEAHEVETVGQSEELLTEEVGPVEKVVEPYIELTEDEKYMLATLIFLEGGGESVECQHAIGSVVINRVTTSGDSLESVIYAKGQFEPAYLIPSTIPEDTQLEIVNELCINGPSLPEYVTYFRADYYHEWSDLTPYKHIDNTYFSFSGGLCYQVMSAAMTEEE